MLNIKSLNSLYYIFEIVYPLLLLLFTMSSRQSPSRSPDRSLGVGARSQFHSPSRISEALEKPLHYESPSKYDLDFYQRKVNRLENDLNHRQD